MREETRRGGSRRRRQSGDDSSAVKREVNYRQLRNPFPMMNVFSEDEIASIHQTALITLEKLGIKVLLPRARELFLQAGATVDESSQMVYIGREIVEAAVSSAPRSVHCHAATTKRDVVLELGNLVFQPGPGAPHATDLERGRRPGTGRDFRELVQITQAFDVMHMMPPLIEPQDVATNVRHYFTMEAQLTLSDKLPFVFSRGTPQVEESFEMLRDFRALSDDEFQSGAHTYTIINTNSPRQLDIPMAQGLIDFARFGQVSIITTIYLNGCDGTDISRRGNDLEPCRGAGGDNTHPTGQTRCANFVTVPLRQTWI